MLQTALPLEAPNAWAYAGLQPKAARPPHAGTPQPATAEAAPDRIGFEIGWDHAQWRLTPPLAHLHAGSPVRQGWAAGRAVIGSRSRRPTPAVRQWLRLRLLAWRDGTAFESQQVTPRFIARLQAPLCPVTRLPLADDEQARDDPAGAVPAQIARLNPQAAVAAGNLAALAPAAAEALAVGSWDAARAQAEQPNSALTPAQWRRLAVLMSFAAPLPHALAATLPLAVLPPVGVRALNPVQALQIALTRIFLLPDAARRLAGWCALMPCEQTRQAARLLLHTLLARRLAVPPQAEPAALRHALEDAWTDDLVLRRWQRLALRLTAAECERLLQHAPRQGLADASLRWLPTGTAIDGWSLETAGRVPLGAARAVGGTQPH